MERNGDEETTSELAYIGDAALTEDLTEDAAPMDEDSIDEEKNSPEIKKIFKFTSFVFFAGYILFFIRSFFDSTFDSLVQSFNANIGLMGSVVGQNTDIVLFKFLSFAFCAFVVAHTIRTLLVISMIEDRKYIFKKFLHGSSHYIRMSETVIRLALILVITARVLSLDIMEDIFYFLLVIYLLSFSWILVINLDNITREDGGRFLNIYMYRSIIGSLLAFFLLFGSGNSEFYQHYISDNNFVDRIEFFLVKLHPIIIVIFTGFFLMDFTLDLKDNITYYWKYFLEFFFRKTDNPEQDDKLNRSMS